MESVTEAATGQVHACALCRTTSNERVVLRGEYEGKEAWVCVGCLPHLIHGGH